MATKRKIIQIVSSRTSLNALCNDGSVWVYLGNDYGWIPMNMKMLTPQQSRRAKQTKFEGKLAELDEWGEPWEDQT